MLAVTLLHIQPAIAEPAGSATPGFAAPVGWAAETAGGRGGEIIRVTSLAADGPGTLREALSRRGPRIIVFEVGGVIDLAMQTLVLDAPNVTVAGQTAPSPGITIIRGGMDIRTHDVILQHLRIRPGEAGQARRSGWGEDAISTIGAHHVIVDQCSLTWATDENLSASGARFTGATPAEWRAATSHDITFSRNIIAEGLADSSHPKGEHSKGSLIHDNVTRLLIYGNLYAHNYERNPLLKGGAHAVLVNNFIYNPGTRAVHYNLQAIEWGAVPYEKGRLTAVGNVLRAGPSTSPDIAFFMLGGSGDIDYHEADTIAVDRLGRALPRFGRYTTSGAAIVEHAEPLDWPGKLQAIPAVQVEDWVLANAGARPWDRDLHDVRITADAAEGRGAIIDSEQEVGGYPEMPATRRAFDPGLWNPETMAPLAPEALDSGAKARGT